MGMIQKMLLSLLVAALPLAGCAAEEGDALPTTSQAGEDAMQEQTGETGANAALLQEESEVRAGTSADTLAAPADFLQEYDYGSGRYDEQSREDYVPAAAGAGGQRDSWEHSGGPREDPSALSVGRGEHAGANGDPL